MASCWARDRQLLGQAGRRRQHLDADAVALHRLDHRVRGDLPERRPGDQRGQLAAQRHPLLDDQLGAAGEQLASSAASAGVVDHPHAAAVVPAAGRLEHHRPADLLAEVGQVGGRGRPAASAAPGRPARPGVRASAACPGRSSSASRRRVERRRPRRPARGCAPSGTCSWSKVTTSQPLANVAQRGQVGVRRRTGRRRRPARRRRRGLGASTRSDWPRAIAAWWVIRASWPPPTMPTTGRPVGIHARPAYPSHRRAQEPVAQPAVRDRCRRA